jgi:hypothetical protein
MALRASPREVGLVADTLKQIEKDPHVVAIS